MSSNSPKIEHFQPNEELQYALLNLEEFARCFSLADKRSIEKAAALYLIRNILHDTSLEIFYEESGKPYLKNGMNISISHSHDWLAMLFSTSSNIGIDIEKVRDKILKIKEKYLSKKELEELKDASLEKYTIYWGAKEALYKACGISGVLFAEQLFIEPFVYSQQGGKINAMLIHDNSQKKHTLHYQVLGDYILVYTENTSE